MDATMSTRKDIVSLSNQFALHTLSLVIAIGGIVVTLANLAVLPLGWLLELLGWVQREIIVDPPSETAERP